MAATSQRSGSSRKPLRCHSHLQAQGDQTAHGRCTRRPSSHRASCGPCLRKRDLSHLSCLPNLIGELHGLELVPSRILVAKASEEFSTEASGSVIVKAQQGGGRACRMPPDSIHGPPSWRLGQGHGVEGNLSRMAEDHHRDLRNATRGKTFAWDSNKHLSCLSHSVSS